jgi:hypothetical protein
MLFLGAIALSLAGLATAYDVEIHPEYQQGLAINDVPADRRLHWMRVANEVRSQPTAPANIQAVYADGHPCPQAPFGSAIVNTTSDELICVISNAVGSTGGEQSWSYASDARPDHARGDHGDSKVY